MRTAIVLLFVTFNVLAATSEQPLSIGNYALPSSQQPGPFYSFGQNIVDKGNAQVFVFPSQLKTMNQTNTTLTGSFLYGLSNDASLLLTFPTILNDHTMEVHASGYGDTGIQGEYAVYNYSASTFTSQATILGAVTLPTGSPRKDPSTGAGVPTYFLGTTYNRTAMDWLWFAATGLYLYQSKDGELPGTQYLYQGGGGKVISSETDRYIFLGLFEIDGQYNDRGRLNYHSNPNSGGNLLYVTPSLWFSTPKWIIQLGYSIPISQYWRGDQTKTSYYTNLTVAYTLS